MKIGPLLAALGGGAGGLAMGGNGAALAGLSPMLALLLQKRGQHGQQHTPGGPEQGPPVMSPGAIQAAPGLAPPAPAPVAPGMDPARRQQIAQRLLQFGQGMNTPFGARY